MKDKNYFTDRLTVIHDALFLMAMFHQMDPALRQDFGLSDDGQLNSQKARDSIINITNRALALAKLASHTVTDDWCDANDCDAMRWDYPFAYVTTCKETTEDDDDTIAFHSLRRHISSIGT